eukprot:gnl/TRDRNA2_/TRDRNA2_102945_c0_seq1.p1 gnl/TRDRNA2_/TRDRNA2_102945_c0~~gnl/TRDRNA2_/TRDRNA2_102945_c0_seq1.p1  ORF type:complete len:395 (+),score=50.89 gnl/TRDRNA2_/TRDRNA2_102945_c0_seq1:2-1186(+)
MWLKLHMHRCLVCFDKVFALLCLACIVCTPSNSFVAAMDDFSDDSTAIGWNECPCVFVGKLEAVISGPVARSMPPIYHHTLTLTVVEVLRGELSIGATLLISHSLRQVDPPQYPPLGSSCLLGAVADASRGLRASRSMGQAPEMRCLRIEEKTDTSYADAALGSSLLFGWVASSGSIRGPWADLGAKAWAPAPGSGIAPLEEVPICSATGRPMLKCGSGVRLSGQMIPPDSAADLTAPSKGGKPKGQWPGGWYEWTNPDGDGDYRLTLTNEGTEDATIPALVQVGAEPHWAASLLIECERRVYQMPVDNEQAAGAALAGEVVHPTVLKPGESISTTINVLRLNGPQWPRGGSRVEFTFWLGELSCGPFSLYYFSSHHDTLRRGLGRETENFQGE